MDVPRYFHVDYCEQQLREFFGRMLGNDIGIKRIDSPGHQSKVLVYQLAPTSYPSANGEIVRVFLRDYRQAPGLEDKGVVMVVRGPLDYEAKSEVAYWTQKFLREQLHPQS